MEIHNIITLILKMSRFHSNGYFYRKNPQKNWSLEKKNSLQFKISQIFDMGFYATY